MAWLYIEKIPTEVTVYIHDMFRYLISLHQQAISFWGVYKTIEISAKEASLLTQGIFWYENCFLFIVFGYVSLFCHVIHYWYDPHNSAFRLGRCSFPWKSSCSCLQGSADLSSVISYDIVNGRKYWEKPLNIKKFLANSYLNSPWNETLWNSASRTGSFIRTLTAIVFDPLAHPLICYRISPFNYLHHHEDFSEILGICDSWILRSIFCKKKLNHFKTNF